MRHWDLAYFAPHLQPIPKPFFLRLQFGKIQGNSIPMKRIVPFSYLYLSFSVFYRASHPPSLRRWASPSSKRSLSLSQCWKRNRPLKVKNLNKRRFAKFLKHLKKIYLVRVCTSRVFRAPSSPICASTWRFSRPPSGDPSSSPRAWTAPVRTSAYRISRA